MSEDFTSEDYFLVGDWRNELNNWLKDNGLEKYRLRYRKMDVAFYRAMESLSLGLLDRRYPLGVDPEIRHEIENCGKHGACQQHTQNGDIRFVGYYCNHRTIHLPCSIRYRAGQGVEMKNQFMEIAKANGLWGFYSWTFTLSEEIRRWIDENPGKAKKFLLDVRREIAKTIRKCFGIDAKSRGVQPGFSIVYHPVSSGDPFKQSSHFHVMIIPLIVDLKGESLVRLQKRFDHAIVKKYYKEYLDKVLVKYGVESFIKKKYVVHLSDMEINKAGSVDHAFKYLNRSPVEDILKRVKKVSDNFESFVCLLVDKKEEVMRPCMKTREEMLDALEFVLRPVVQVRMSYGFMRVLDKYSDLLGIEKDLYLDDDFWDHLFYIDIMRIKKYRYDVKRGKVLPILSIYIRGPDDEDWVSLDRECLMGEQTCMSDRKLYKAKEVCCESK